MCAILDNNVVGQVFGSEAPPAGKGFLNSGNGLVTCGELNGSSKLVKRDGQLRRWRVDDRAEELNAGVSLR